MDAQNFTDNKEITDYFESEDWDSDELEILLDPDLLQNKNFQRFAVSKASEHLVAFDLKYVSLDLIIEAHDNENYQTDRDKILLKLTADVINDEFIHKFDFFGSAIFQIIDKVESQHLRLDSIHLLLKKLCDEINESTNQKSLCTYGNDDDYYHWIECLSWQSFSNFINNQSNLKNADTANLLELLRDAINNHFEMLKIEDITSLLGPEPFFEDPFQIMDDWLNGLEELIDRYE